MPQEAQLTEAAFADAPVAPSTHPEADAERFVRLSSAVIFLIFFQTYLIAPLIPSLAIAFGVTQQKVGLLVPAYTLPYACAAILYGALADRLGRRGMYFASLVGFPLLSLALAFAPTMNSLLALRALCGACNAGLIVMVLTLVGDLFPIAKRGHALGWIFGAIAGGGAFGSTLAGVLAPIINWRGLFAITAAVALLVVLPLVKLWNALRIPLPPPAPVRTLATGYFAVLSSGRAARTYAFIFLNGAFHSGVFTWFGVHLHERYGLGEVGIGLALLGYGVPGFLLGPAIGRVVDRHGRRALIPAGFLVASAAAALLIPRLPLLAPVLVAPMLSLGFDMTHPLLAGIATSLDPNRRGQAMGLNTFAIFGGYGCGSLLFGSLAVHGTTGGFAAYASIQLAAAIVALFAFRSE